MEDRGSSESEFYSLSSMLYSLSTSRRYDRNMTSAAHTNLSAQPPPGSGTLASRSECSLSRDGIRCPGGFRRSVTLAPAPVGYGRRDARSCRLLYVRRTIPPATSCRTLPYDVNGRARPQTVKEKPAPTTCHLRRYGRYWAVYDERGELVAVCV